MQSDTYKVFMSWIVLSVAACVSPTDEEVFRSPQQ